MFHLDSLPYQKNLCSLKWEKIEAADFKHLNVRPSTEIL